jgi:hypothetical protein
MGENPLVHSIEAQFHGAANASMLRQLHADGQYTALLEYALLLAEQEASQRSQIQWLIREAASGGVPPVQQWHLEVARELSGG